MPPEEFQIVIRKPLAEVEKDLRKRYELGRNGFLSAYIQDGGLVMVFGATTGPEALQTSQPIPVPPGTKPGTPRRRRKAKRNRTKTRGWKPIATITNAVGQRVRVYDVFVNALKGKELSRTEQKKLVEGILRSNRNHPAPDQVEYFLDNTLEYLRLQGAIR